jgi:hypothetical protein
LFAIVLLVCSSLVVFTNAVLAQGQFDATFGTNGAATQIIPANEQVIGADAQDSGPFADKIIVATSILGTYYVRRFNETTGALDPTFGAGGLGISLATGGNMIYVAGQGSSPNICSVVRFNANGLSPLIKNVTLPNPFSNCAAKVHGSYLYISGISSDSTSRRGLTTIRFNLPALTVDSTWGQAASLEPTWRPGHQYSVGRSGFEAPGAAPKVYVAGRLNAPGELPKRREHLGSAHPASSAPGRGSNHISCGWR